MKTLIIYATKHGTTGKCASALSGKLSGEVDLCNIKDGRSIDLMKYDRVIIGGSIYAGRIQKEISLFCSRNLDSLKEKKLGLFICCIVKKNAEMQLNTAFPQELLKAAAARESFGGEMLISDMGFGEKLLVSMISKMAARDNTGLPKIDPKNDVSMIDEESIDKFIRLMNIA